MRTEESAEKTVASMTRAEKQALEKARAPGHAATARNAAFPQRRALQDTSRFRRFSNESVTVSPTVASLPEEFCANATCDPEAKSAKTKLEVYAVEQEVECFKLKQTHSALAVCFPQLPGLCFRDVTAASPNSSFLGQRLILTACTWDVADTSSKHHCI